MSFNYATQPELIRASQKDSEIIQQIYQNICNLLEYFVSTRQIYNQINTIKMLSNLTYYLLTYLREVKTIGEEYTNIQVFNYSDYDNHYVPLQKKRKVLFILLQFLSFFIQKLRSRQIMHQQQHQSNKLLRYIPDINDIMEGIQDFHLALFLISGTYFEMSKRLTQIQYIFNRIPPTHNIQYKRIGQAYLLLLSLQFVKYLYNFILKIKNENMKDQVNKERNIATNENKDKYTQCLICYDNATNVTCTACGHLFCWDCIMQQIILKQQCPICRQSCQVQQLIQLYNYN